MNGLIESMQESISAGVGPMIATFIVVVVTIVVAFVIQHLLVKFIRSRLIESSFGSVSIFEHLARILVWLLAAVVLCEPVLGIKPTGLVAALGVGTLVISLGLQDTISNVFSGLQLSAYKVVKPGDHVEIDGVRGVVSDVTWRHTTIVDKNGDCEVFPNSYLNKVSLKQLTEDNGYRFMFNIEVRPLSDLDAVAADIVATAKSALIEGGYLQEGLDPAVKFTGHTAYGVQTSVRIYIKSELMAVPAVDAVMRALKQRPYLSDTTIDHEE